MNFFKRLFNKPQQNIAKPGDWVLCIDDRSAPNGIYPKVIYKQKYQVLDVIKCSHCELFCYDIGLRTYNSTNTHCCKNNFLPSKNIHWAGSHRFTLTTPHKSEKQQTENISIILEPKIVIEEQQFL